VVTVITTGLNRQEYIGNPDSQKIKELTAKLDLKGGRPLEELKRIRIALIKEEGGTQWVVEEMTKEQAALFSYLNLGEMVSLLK
jgi:hypothetical protein